jgi:hypothetical protein
MGMGRLLSIPIPMFVMHITARLAETLPQRVLSRDTLNMLVGGNASLRDDAARLLGRAPIKTDRFIPPAMQDAMRLEAVGAWAVPLLRATLALMWIVTAFVSVSQRDLSLDLLARTGITGQAAELALYGAAGLDLVLGLWALWRPNRWLWLAQIALILGYTAIITLRLPEFWAHPFGPLLKNLPILAILMFLYSMAPAQKRT